MEKFLDEADAIIKRPTEGRSIVNIFDEDGFVFSFPAGWTDDQVKVALRFANYGYDRGIKVGKRRKAQEIQMNDQEHEEIEAGHQEFLKVLPFVIGISALTAWLISFLAKHNF